MDGLVTDVVYEYGTNRVVMVKYDNVWVLPDNWGLAHFEGGAKPVLQDVGDDTYIKPNTVIITNPHK